MTLLRSLLCILFLGYFQLSACDRFQEANQAYFEAKFEQAIEVYSSCEQKDFAILYNLANAYYKTQQLGKAIQYYRKAQQIEPENENLRYNLEMATRKTLDEEDLVSYPIKQINKDRIFFNAYLILILTLVFYGLRKRLTMFPAIAFLLVFMGYLLSYQELFHKTSKQAVVLTKEVDLRSNRNRQATALTQIHEGKLVTVVDTVDNWYLVKVSKELKGWVEQSALGLI